jgi:hypothetical protein
MLAEPLYSVFDRSYLEKVKKDCIAAFNCRSVSGSDNYSTGATYFIRANETPSCNLEHLAQQLFKHHTQGLSFDSARSGAEWWTQAIDSRDDIGFHWDRDYGSENKNGVHIYPRLGTVTYITDAGGPTLVMDREGTADSGEPLIGSIQSFSASKPMVGKHISFKGNLLHAAPSGLDEDDEDSGDSDEEGSEEADDTGVQRITFLVNIWVDHTPIDSKRFPKKELKKLLPVQEKMTLQLANKTPTGAKTMQLTRKQCPRSKVFEFNNSEVNYDVKVPLPAIEVVQQTFRENDMVHFEYVSEKKSKGCYDGHGVEILFSENQPSGDEGDEYSEGTGEDQWDSGELELEEGSEVEEEVVVKKKKEVKNAPPAKMKAMEKAPPAKKNKAAEKAPPPKKRRY